MTATATAAGAAPPVPGHRSILRTLGTWAQFALIVLVIRVYQVESRSFFEVALLACLAFPVHALLPPRLSLPFFAALSLAALPLALGTSAAGWTLGLGLTLIGIAHLPLRLAWRVALLVAVGLGLALARTGSVALPVPPGVWPVLGSMFMFRMAVYLYDRSHSREPARPARTLAYFFMLPNVCFPLFPVVDYNAFTRSDQDPASAHAVGLRWMARGVMHLLLYRLVYFHLVAEPSEVRTLGQLALYLAATFVLYLRVSGQFHLIVGLLCMFGFRLPETNHLYFLASSFTDFWRRINIYWKDFMTKLVFNPCFFALRRLGEVRALVLSTVIVFIATWLLHSYQWFWLLDAFPVTATDALFWGVLGAAVAVNAVVEARRGRKRTAGRKTWSPGLAIRTVATLATLTVLWNLWNAASLEEFLSLWSAAPRAGARDLALVALGLAALVAVCGWPWGAATLGPAPARRPRLLRVETLAVASLAALLLVAHPTVQGAAGPLVRRATITLRANRLSRRDEALMQRGYYEQLNTAGRLNTQTWQVDADRPREWVPIQRSEFYRARADILFGELVASRTGVFRDRPFTTNRWGMRDREYPLEKPPGTWRLALVGPSDAMGSGVGDEQAFEARLEEQLNRDRAGAPHAAYQVLNFSVGGYSLVQLLAVLDQRVSAFSPDAVIVTYHPGDPEEVVRTLARAVRENVAIPFPELAAVVDSLALRADLPAREAESRLLPLRYELTRRVLALMAERSRAMNVRPVLLSLRNPTTTRLDDRPLQDAAEAGFLVINLSDAYRGYDEDDMRLRSYDRHPNARGHQVLADRLYEELLAHGEALRLIASAAGAGRRR
jgi:hypothetical protein